MARITVEDCLDNESNRFALVRLAARRAKQLLSGSHPVTDTKGNRAIVSALREIASGKVKFKNIENVVETKEVKPQPAVRIEPVATPAVEAPSTSEPVAAVVTQQEVGV